jgi:acetolactate synthase I/II/III large subunit
MKRTGAQILWECLVREGVTTVFGYPGGAILPAYDAMLDYPIRHVLVRHEQGATHMADGYARAGGGVGVAIATSGPGATNMVTGIATAMMDSSPIVCITGQVGSKLIGSDGFQETDITGVTLPVTKHNYLVTRAQDIAPAVREAFHIAQSGRPGPVLIDITKDAQQTSCGFDWDAAAPKPHARPERIVNPDAIRHALALINSAERPVILGGHGIILSKASACVREFAERAQIAHRDDAARDRRPAGVAPAEPRHDGHARRGLGQHGDPGGGPPARLGMRFDDRVTGNLKTYAPHARKIHVDIDPAEIGKNVPVDVPLVGDLRDVLQELLPGVAAASNAASAWLERIASLKGDSAVRDIQNLPDTGHLYAAHVINDLWRATDGGALVVTDVGQHQMWEAQYYHHDEPRRSSRPAAWAPWASRCRPRSGRRWPARTPRSGSSPATAASR